MGRPRAQHSGSSPPITTCLSAHQRSKDYPTGSKAPHVPRGATAQVAGGVPAMCDGVTQGQVGMELSLVFPRREFALAAGVALSHNTFDAALLSGRVRQDRSGPRESRRRNLRYLPGLFVPAGPMRRSGPATMKIEGAPSNSPPVKVGRDKLIGAEMALLPRAGHLHLLRQRRSNQMLMEFNGASNLPGRGFREPRHGPARRADRRRHRTRRAITALGNAYTPVW